MSLLLGKLLDIMASFAEEYKYERVEERNVDETTGETTLEVGEDWGAQDPRMNFVASPARDVKQPPRDTVHFHHVNMPNSAEGEHVVMEEFATFREVPLSKVAFPKSGAVACTSDSMTVIQ